MIAQPEPTEYGPYYESYISKVKGKDIAELLASQVEELRFIVDQIDDETAERPYAPEKWTYKELLGHINDTEKIMFFRALCIARNERQALPGFDQDEYVEATNFNEIPLADFMEDFEHTRNAIAYFVKHLNTESSSRVGTVSGNPMSVKALLHIICGHLDHHLEILKSVTQSDTGK
ncbi:MAG TPA: DinB family protein [Cyclobacteriaceae bacterium]|nr:DinB family protein [Cyclobacteriaceae bacterium]